LKTQILILASFFRIAKKNPQKMNAKIILIVFAMSASCLAFGQDTTSVPVKEGDPALNQSPSQIEQSMLQDMVRIPQRQVPEEVKKAVQGNDFKGIKTFFKHRNKEEYAVEVTVGEVSSMHFFDKDGKPLNQRKQ
jgi:hypothetical protein